MPTDNNSRRPPQLDPETTHTLATRIARTVRETRTRLTLPMLEQSLENDPPRPGMRKRIRAAIRVLIDRGELIYTYEHGCSFIEQAFNRSVRISPHVVITPPHQKVAPGKGDIVVKLEPGASFGSGSHPTTRAAVRCLDQALVGETAPGSRHNTAVLDIGTGSGILMITALMMGVKKGVGIDRDPCAVFAARENLRCNGLTHRAVAGDQDLAAMADTFSLVTANLRYPTLIQIAPKIASLLLTGGLSILSGMKVDEYPAVAAAHHDSGCAPLWQITEKGWIAAVFKKSDHKKHPKTINLR